MNKHITPGRAAYEYHARGDYTVGCPDWEFLSADKRHHWTMIAREAIHAHFSSIGARGGGKGTPAQARAARKNGLANRKSKGKPRPG